MKVLFVSAYGPWKRPNPFIRVQADSLREIGIDVTDFHFRQRGIWGNIKYFFILRSFLKKNHFDIIHAHFTYIGLLAAFAAPKSKLVLSFMGTDLMGMLNENAQLTFKGRLNILLSRLVQAKCDRIIVKSTRMYDFIIPKYRNITSILPNGVNFEKFPLVDKVTAQHKLSLKPDKKHILFLGDTKSAIKNFALLKEAFSLLDMDKAELICPYPVKAEAIHLYLNAADVLAFPSLQEGSPNIIKEALACNCPIVATDVGDVSERIREVSGCYIAAFNASDFADKLNTALMLTERTNGRESLEHLSTEKIAREIYKIYSRINKKVEKTAVIL